jgi:hypothetical protein
MKQTFIILSLVLILTACNQNRKATNSTKQNDTTYLGQEKQEPQRLSFKNITEIIADSSYGVWVEKQDSSFSLALHFQERDTLAISYSPECWLAFPYKLDKDQLIVYWDNNIDTKYEFDIVRAIKKVDKKYIGKPFMILELLNDTTLSAAYPLNGLRTSINNSSKQRTFFPDKFYLVQEGEMYD